MSSVAIGRFKLEDRRVFTAASAVTASAVIVKLVATLKELIVAGAYGRSDALEAFLLAALLPALLSNVISEAMNQALIPTLVRVKGQKGQESAERLLSNTMLSILVLLTSGSLIIAAAGPLVFPIFAAHFNGPKLDLAIRLFYGLLPAIVLTGVASICTTVLNTAGDFAIPALAPIVTPVALIACVPLFARTTGPWALVFAMIAGALVHSVWMAKRTNARCYRLRLRWYGLSEESREVARQFWPVMLSAIVASGGLVVDQAMAATLPAGSLSALAYAGRFVSVPLVLLGGAISSATAPAFSEMVARGDWGECRRSLRTWSWTSLAVSSSVAVLLIAGARVIVQLTLQHGVFGRQDTAVVSSVLMMYALQIPFFVCSRVFYRFLIAMRRTDILLYCGLLNLILDIILNLVLMRRMGVAGIALATSLWSVSTLIFLRYWARRLLASASRMTPSVAGASC